MSASPVPLSSLSLSTSSSAAARIVAHDLARRVLALQQRADALCGLVLPDGDAVAERDGHGEAQGPPLLWERLQRLTEPREVVDGGDGDAGRRLRDLEQRLERFMTEVGVEVMLPSPGPPPVSDRVWEERMATLLSELPQREAALDAYLASAASVESMLRELARSSPPPEEATVTGDPPSDRLLTPAEVDELLQLTAANEQQTQVVLAQIERLMDSHRLLVDHVNRAVCRLDLLAEQAEERGPPPPVT